jgi:hypothetical protein
MKSWYTSKTLWINLSAIGALIAQSQFGYILSPEIQATILGIVNLALRTITNSPLDWSTGSAPPDESGRIRLPLLFLLAAFACLIALTGGCATTGQSAHVDTPLQTAGKSLLAVKGTIVTAAKAADALCKTGSLTPNKCAQAKDGYELAKPAYDSAVDAYLLMSQGYATPDDFALALGRVQTIADKYLQLSVGLQ